MTTEAETATDLDSILEKFADTPERGVRVELVGREIVRAAALYADAATRPQAAALFKAWAEAPGDGLRKAIASHFIDRAKSIVQTGSVTGPGGALTGKPPVHPMIAKLRAGGGRKKPPGVMPPGMGKSATVVHPVLAKLQKAFDESRHKRDKGRFTAGSGGDNSSTLGTAGKVALGAAAIGAGVLAARRGGPAGGRIGSRLGAMFSRRGVKPAATAATRAYTGPAEIGRPGFISGGKLKPVGKKTAGPRKTLRRAAPNKVVPTFTSAQPNTPGFLR